MPGPIPVCAERYGTGTPTEAECCPAPSCALEYREKSGTATLCGIEEYTSPSTPPKKYRTQTIGGDSYYCDWPNLMCTDPVINSPNSANHHAYDGQFLYDSTTCATNNLQRDRYYTGQNIACADAPLNSTTAPPEAFTPNFGGYGSVAEITTPTSKQWTADDVCNTLGANSYKGSGQVSKALSDEDTDDDAIVRANASLSWSTCSSSCIAYTETRGAGDFSFVYKTIQYRFTASGCRPGIFYVMEILLQRRLHGTADPFVDWVTVSNVFAGPACSPIPPAAECFSDYVSEWLQIPVSTGYDVQIGSCTAYYQSS